MKITSAKLQPGMGDYEFAFSVNDILKNAALGSLPGWFVMVIVAVFYGWILYATFRPQHSIGEHAHGEVHV